MVFRCSWSMDAVLGVGVRGVTGRGCVMLQMCAVYMGLALSKLGEDEGSGASPIALFAALADIYVNKLSWSGGKCSLPS